MYFVGTIIAVAVLSLSLVVISKTLKKRKQNKNRDSYNGFHLGEMTKHDVPRTKYSGRTVTNKKRDGKKI